MSSLSVMELASGQGLKNVDKARLVHWAGEMGTAADPPPVHEDRHVPAQRRLVVEDVSTGLRVGDEDIVQHFANRAPGNLGLGAGNVALYIGREHDLGHRWYSFRTGPASGRLIPQHVAHRTNGRVDSRQAGRKKGSRCRRWPTRMATH